MCEVQCDKFNFKNNLLTLDITYYNFSFLLNMYIISFIFIYKNEILSVVLYIRVPKFSE